MLNKKKKEIEEEKSGESEARRKEKEEKWLKLQEDKKGNEAKVGEEKPKLGPKTGLSYTLLIQIGAMILISVLVCRMMVPILAPTLPEFLSKMDEVAAGYNYLDGRIDEVEESIPDVSDFATNADLSWVSDKLEKEIGDSGEARELLTQGILNIQTTLDSQVKPKVEYELAGSFGNYTIEVRASEAGNFTARLNLVYNPARNVGTLNSTFEEALLSFNSTWLTSLDKDYTPDLVYDGGWKVSGVSFLTGKFSLGTVSVTSVGIRFSGLNETPDYVFVEIFPVL